jgi:hypothetical protein
MLEVRLQRAERTNEVTMGCKTSIASNIRERLECLKKKSPTAASVEGDRDWIEAAQLERQLVLIEPRDFLLDEAKSRISEVFDEKLSCAPRFQSALIKIERDIKDIQQDYDNLSPIHENSLRSLILRILEELHWAAERKYYSQFIRKSATRRIVTFGIIAFLCFILPYIILHLRLVFQGPDPNPIEKWSFLPLYTAVTAGWFGAMFSRLIYLHLKWDALSMSGLKTAQEYTSIFLRGCVGMTGAVILFFFLQSGIVTGTLLPKFAEISVQYGMYPSPPPNSDEHSQPSPSKPDANKVIHLIFPNINLALLVVWSFLAGFSERLVPNILQDAEGSLEKDRP